eukprot:m.12167 g.12167  ORF g.12167 m.12167 type:complete len:501 (-) comp4600_c0_seq1:133-1635(-)
MTKKMKYTLTLILFFFCVLLIPSNNGHGVTEEDTQDYLQPSFRLNLLNQTIYSDNSTVYLSIQFTISYDVKDDWERLRWINLKLHHEKKLHVVLLGKDTTTIAHVHADDGKLTHRPEEHVFYAIVPMINLHPCVVVFPEQEYTLSTSFMATIPRNTRKTLLPMVGNTKNRRNNALDVADSTFSTYEGSAFGRFNLGSAKAERGMCSGQNLWATTEFPSGSSAKAVQSVSIDHISTPLNTLENEDMCCPIRGRSSNKMETCVTVENGVHIWNPKNGLQKIEGRTVKYQNDSCLVLTLEILEGCNGFAPILGTYAHILLARFVDTNSSIQPISPEILSHTHANPGLEALSHDNMKCVSNMPSNTFKLRGEVKAVSTVMPMPDEGLYKLFFQANTTQCGWILPSFMLEVISEGDSPQDHFSHVDHCGKVLDDRIQESRHLEDSMDRIIIFAMSCVITITILTGIYQHRYSRDALGPNCVAVNPTVATLRNSLQTYKQLDLAEV